MAWFFATTSFEVATASISEPTMAPGCALFPGAMVGCGRRTSSKFNPRYTPPHKKTKRAASARQARSTLPLLDFVKPIGGDIFHARARTIAPNDVDYETSGWRFGRKDEQGIERG